MIKNAVIGPRPERAHVIINLLVLRFILTYSKKTLKDRFCHGFAFIPVFKYLNFNWNTVKNTCHYHRLSCSIKTLPYNSRYFC